MYTLSDMAQDTVACQTIAKVVKHELQIESNSS